MQSKLHFHISVFFQITCFLFGFPILHGNPRVVAERYEKPFSIAASLPNDPEDFISSPLPENVAKLEEVLNLIRENTTATAVDWGIEWNGTNIKGCLMKNESIYRGFWLKQMDESCKKQRRLPKVSAIRPYLRQENRQCGIGIPACGPGIKSGTKDSPGFRVRMTFTTLSSDDM